MEDIKEWTDLPISVRAKYIRHAVANGLKSIDDIRDSYNNFKQEYSDNDTVAQYEQLPDVLPTKAPIDYNNQDDIAFLIQQSKLRQQQFRAEMEASNKLDKQEMDAWNGEMDKKDTTYDWFTQKYNKLYGQGELGPGFSRTLTPDDLGAVRNDPRLRVYLDELEKQVALERKLKRDKEIAKNEADAKKRMEAIEKRQQKAQEAADTARWLVSTVGKNEATPILSPEQATALAQKSYDSRVNLYRPVLNSIDATANLAGVLFPESKALMGLNAITDMAQFADAVTYGDSLDIAQSTGALAVSALGALAKFRPRVFNRLNTGYPIYDSSTGRILGYTHPYGDILRDRIIPRARRVNGLIDTGKDIYDIGKWTYSIPDGDNQYFISPLQEDFIEVKEE